MRILGLILLFLGFYLIGNGQTFVTRKNAPKPALKAYEKAIELSKKKELEKALDFFEKSIEAAPTFIDAFLQKAAIYYDMENYTASLENFEAAIALSTDYRTRTLYRMGLCALRIPDYEKAIMAFRQFLDKDPSNESLVQRAQKHLANAQFAKEATQNPLPFDPIRLSDNINTGNPEFLPSLSIDGQTLVFNRNVGGQEDFFTSYKKNGEWQPAEPMAGINTKLNEAAQSISADGQLMVLTACNRKNNIGGCDLYFTTKIDGQWIPGKIMPPPVNSKYWESTPSISGNRDALFFASERPGGQGGSDLWVSYFRENAWQQPINLGPNINTPEDEQSPFIHPDGETLYFMSKGHPGMGNFDLYISRKQEDGTWGQAQNLGYPINTTGDEGAMIVTRDGKTAYFSGAKLGEEKNAGKLKGDSDLFQFELPESIRPTPVTYLQAKVYDAITHEPVVASVNILDLGNGRPFSNVRTDKDGNFLVCIPIGRSYSLNVNQKGYLFYSDHFDLETVKDISAPYILEIPLEPIIETPKVNEMEVSSSKPIVLRNIFFETGSATLLETSIAELQQLERLLEENATLKIQINGHTDNVGNDADNLNLSEARAKAVYDFLVDNGIDSTRLAYKGFGETQPVEDNETEAGRQRNRRTEFVVIN